MPPNDDIGADAYAARTIAHNMKVLDVQICPNISNLE